MFTNSVAYFILMMSRIENSKLLTAGKQLVNSVEKFLTIITTGAQIRKATKSRWLRRLQPLFCIIKSKACSKFVNLLVHDRNVEDSSPSLKAS
jgi:hypothetical protein